MRFLMRKSATHPAAIPRNQHSHSKKKAATGMMRITRPSNATAHPGLIDRGSVRRSTQEVQADRETKAAAKAKAATDKKVKLQAVAELEARSRKRMKATDQLAMLGDSETTVPKKKPRSSTLATSTKGIVHLKILSSTYGCGR
jgi:hypothetical protein